MKQKQNMGEMNKKNHNLKIKLKINKLYYKTKMLCNYVINIEKSFFI
jgi:hypothetical protein